MLLEARRSFSLALPHGGRGWVFIQDLNAGPSRAPHLLDLVYPQSPPGGSAAKPVPRGGAEAQGFKRFRRSREARVRCCLGSQALPPGLARAPDAQERLKEYTAE